jgi:adenylate cyclase
MDERVERRLVAVLAADVAGYSRLMGADEEGTLAQLKACRKALFDPKIAEHRGRIVKTTGDGMLVEFASAVDAARCAVELQRSMAEQNTEVPQVKRMEFRIGIHVGDIIIDENDIFGDGVNIAARLEGIAEAGGICMSEDTYRQVRGKVEIIFDDLGPQTLKNIAEPVRAWRVQRGGQRPTMALPGSPADQAPALALPDKPSIAVLPFQNMSGDPEQEYLADGMTEDIITLLSQTRDFIVIARSSTAALKTKSIDVTNIGQQLGVRYILEGSVRKAGNKIRVNAQLVEARTANRIWANHFDRELVDLFAVQDDVASGIVGALHPQLLTAEAQAYRRQPPSSLDAWGLVARGMMALISFKEENLTTAADLASRAIAIAPEFGLSYGLRAFALGYRAYMQWGGDWRADAKQASADIKRALSEQGDDPTVLFLAGGASWFMGRVLSGVGLLERAIQLNPNLAMARALLSLGYASLDRPIDGLIQVNAAFRLSPRDPMACQFFAAQTLCNFVAGDFLTAIASAERGLHINANSIDNHLYMAASLAKLGESARAARQVQLALRITPKITLEVIARGARDAPGWAKYHAALRHAGLPE